MKKVIPCLALVLVFVMLLNVKTYASQSQIQPRIVESIDQDEAQELIESIDELEKLKGIENIIPNDVLDRAEEEARTNGELSEQTINDILDSIEKNATNDEVANLIRENKDTLNSYGIPNYSINLIESSLDNGVLNVEDFTQGIRNFVDILENGGTPEEAFDALLTDNAIISLIASLFLMFGTIFIVALLVSVLITYILDSIILWRLFKKAQMPGWSGLIPFYRKVQYLKLCQFNPWFYAVAFIPFIGIPVFKVIETLSKMRLSEKFGHGLPMAIGLALFPHIFGLILAFNSSKYEGVEQPQFNSEEFK